MNILYGVCGEGFGHSSRALSIGKYLESKGHKLIILVHGQSYDVLKDEFKVFQIHGMHMIFNNGILKKRKTAYHNLRIFPKNILKIKKLRELVKDFKPDLCICDMEPVVSILANFYKIPLITIDNQHLLTNFNIKVPKKYKKDFELAKIVIKAYSIGAKYSIVTGFGNEKPLEKNTFLVYPIIRDEVRKLKPVYSEQKNQNSLFCSDSQKPTKYKTEGFGDGKKILVYLNRYDENNLNILKNINETFVVFGFNVNKKDKNLEFKTRDFFLGELKNCRAIIATAGFSLMSEAIYLKKPYFALPLKGHFEQIFNSLFLKESGFGEYSEDLTKKKVLNFLKNLDKYKKNIGKYKMDYNKLFEIIDEVLKKIERK